MASRRTASTSRVALTPSGGGHPHCPRRRGSVTSPGTRAPSRVVGNFPRTTRPYRVRAVVRRAPDRGGLLHSLGRPDGAAAGGRRSLLDGHDRAVTKRLLAPLGSSAVARRSRAWPSTAANRSARSSTCAATRPVCWSRLCWTRAPPGTTPRVACTAAISARSASAWTGLNPSRSAPASVVGRFTRCASASWPRPARPVAPTIPGP